MNYIMYISQNTVVHNSISIYILVELYVNINRVVGYYYNQANCISFLYYYIWDECSHVSPVPGADVELAAVDDTGELKQHGEPATHPDPVLLRDGHHLLVVTHLLTEHLRGRNRMGIRNHILGC